MASKHPSQKRYPPELKERAVRMVLDLQRADPADHSVIARVGRQLGVCAESLRNWVKQEQRDSGVGPEPTSDEHTELVELRKEVKELRRANDIGCGSFTGTAPPLFCPGQVADRAFGLSVEQVAPCFRGTTRSSMTPTSRSLTSQAAYTGQAPPSCYDLSDSQITVLSGQTYTFPEPICYQLSSSTDRIQAVLDTDIGSTIPVS